MPVARRQLRVHEVSLCATPANPLATVGLFKTDPEGDPSMNVIEKLHPSLRDRAKNLTKGALDTLALLSDDVLGKADGPVATMIADHEAAIKAATEAARKAAEAPKDPPKVEKDTLSPEVRAYVEGVEKAADDLKKQNEALASRVGKLEDDTLTADLKRRVSTYKFAVPADKIDAEVASLKALPEAARKSVFDALDRAEAVAKTAAKAVTTPIGSDAGGAGVGSAVEKATAAARELMKADPKLTLAAARVQVFKNDPELRAEYETERRKSN